jgi:nitrogen regulatory protein PII
MSIMDGNRSGDTVRARGREIAGAPEAPDPLLSAELLAAVADRTLPIDLLDDETLERVTRTAGVDAVADAVTAAATEQAMGMGTIYGREIRWYRQPFVMAAAASVAIAAGALAYFVPGAGPSHPPETTQAAAGAMAPEDANRGVVGPAAVGNAAPRAAELR